MGRKNKTFVQSGVIPWRKRKGELQVLVITSRKGKRWVIPKGLVERNLLPAESAAKEAYEEAGIEGIVDPDPVGEFRYEKWGGACNVTVFMMEVTVQYEEWPEDHRERNWTSPEKAAELVEEDALRKMLLRSDKHVPKD